MTLAQRQLPDARPDATDWAPRIRKLGLRPYAPVFESMRRFTHQRGPETPDELWLLQHRPVFTQGQAGRSEHLLTPGDIPIVQSDRGGQVTYHGPGQLVVYFLLDLQRLGYGIRSLVSRLETATVACLAAYGIAARAKREAPGVYVDEAGKPAASKIASLGLRVRRGCTYHGIALNVAMDLEPFSRINPCGYQGLRMTQISECGGPVDVDVVAADLLPHLLRELAPAARLRDA